MSVSEFKDKWNGGLKHTGGGKIVFLESENSYTILIPNWFGWESDKQRKEFYKDAKAVGCKRALGKKMEYYLKKDK